MNEKERFREYLSRQNLRSTYQRELILDVFFSHPEHLSPEELYELVKKRDPAIGQATVYRTLKLLVDAGIASKVEFGDGIVRYEHKAEHHDHLICEVCGKSLEVVDPLIESLQERLAEKYEFELKSHKMYLYGICKECKEKNQ